MNDLGSLLERATDAIEPSGLGAAALVEARRRHARARGRVAALTAAAAVVVLVVSVQVTAGGPRTEERPAGEPAPTRPVEESAPQMALDRIQPVWEPRGAAALPEVEAGLPQVLPGTAYGAVGTAAVLLDDGDEAVLVAPDGSRATLEVPPGLGDQRTLSLSPDGRRVAAVGLSGLFWRRLDETSWRRVDDVPSSVTGEGIGVTWLPDGGSVLLQSHLPAVEVDLETGGRRELPHLRSYAAFDVAPDGAVVTTGLTGGVTAVREWRGEEVARQVNLGEIRNLQRPVVGGTSIAAARSSGTLPSPERPQDADGLVALDRRTLATRAFLPVRDGVSYYVDGGALSPQAWLDADTVLFTVLPKGSGGAAGPKKYLLTWDVRTGELRRAACWDAAYDASLATDLLELSR